MKVLKNLLAVLAIAGWASSVSAGPLTGQTLGNNGNIGASPANALVGSGVEFNYDFGDLDFDFDEDGLFNITFVRGEGSHAFGPGSAFVDFSDLNGTIADIIGFNLLSVDAGIAGIEQSDLSFTANSVRVGVGAASWTYVDSNPAAYMQVVFAEQSPVPAPATLALFGLGLAGLGWSRRKKA
jgi:hypothetical protein